MACRLCNERGKTWNGSDPKCAFDDNGTFKTDNWNCATMSQLRKIADHMQVTTRDDLSCGSIGYVPVDASFFPDELEEDPNYQFSGYITMAWYKDRGKTANAIFISDDELKPMTIIHAESAIKTFEDRYK